MARLPAYAAALDQLCQQIPGFVPAIFGEAGSKDAKAEIRDLDKQRVMERRACLRMRPDIQNLIEAGAREYAPVDNKFIATAVLAALSSSPVWDTDSSGGMGNAGINERHEQTGHRTVRKNVGMTQEEEEVQCRTTTGMYPKGCSDSSLP